MPPRRPYRPGRQPSPATSRAAARRLLAAQQRQRQQGATAGQPAVTQEPAAAQEDISASVAGDAPVPARTDGGTAKNLNVSGDPDPAEDADTGHEEGGEAVAAVTETAAAEAVDAGTATEDAEKPPAEGAEEGAGEAAGAGGIRGRLAGRPLLLPALLGMVTVILGGLAVWFGVQAHNLTSQPSARDTALTDTATTSQVKAQVTSAVEAVFSYNYAHPARTSDVARRVLTGSAVRQYATKLKPVESEAPKDKLTLTTKVTASGVELLQGNRARVLMFGTQTFTYAGAVQPQTVGTLLAVNAIRQDGTWKIDSIDTFTGSA